MGIEKITEKILAESNNDARRIYEKGVYDSRETIYEVQRKIKKMQGEMVCKSKQEAAILKNRRKSVGELEARKQRLNAKQQAVSTCFEEALVTLSELPKDQYMNLLIKTISESGEKSGVLFLNARDMESIGKQLVDRLNKELAGEFTLGDGSINAKGGLVLKNGTVEMNATLETMIAGVRDELTPKVVETLFV